jgi:hypothetical protein
MINVSEWQLCPMCAGEGQIDNVGTSTSIKRVCPVCNGARTLIKPVYDAGALTQNQKMMLAEIYGALWTEGYYDPLNTFTQYFAKPLADKMSQLNEELKFKP